VLTDADAHKGDRVEQYVVTLCAKQLLHELGRLFPGYWAEHREDVKQLESRLGAAASLRDAVAGGSPDMPAFLEWFERWFLRVSALHVLERASAEYFVIPS
jgi:hypothetical protein